MGIVWSAATEMGMSIMLSADGVARWWNAPLPPERCAPRATACSEIFLRVTTRLFCFSSPSLEISSSCGRRLQKRGRPSGYLLTQLLDVGVHPCRQNGACVHHEHSPL